MRRLASRLKLLLSNQSYKQMESREDKGSAKVWIRDHDVYRDFSVKPDINDSLDSLRPFGLLSIPSCSTALSFACYIHPYHFSSWPFSRQAARKNWATEKLPLRVLRNTRGDSHINFTTKVMVALIGSVIWEPSWGRCGRRLLALFSQIFFSLETDALNNYNSKGMCSIAL